MKSPDWKRRLGAGLGLACLLWLGVAPGTARATSTEAVWGPIPLDTRHNHAPELEITSVTPSGVGETKRLQINYRYRDPDSASLTLALSASADNGVNWNVPVTTIAGNTTVTATPDWQAGSLTWSAGLDWHNQYSAQMKLKLVADDGYIPLVVQSISLTPATATKAPGEAQAYAVTVTYSDSTQDGAGDGVTLTADPANKVTIAGLNVTVNANASPGDVALTASYSGQTAQATLAVSGDYLVVDLTAGPDALSYPVSYLTAVPAGGWTDEYKTTKIVLRKIPHGTFTMGSPIDELGRDAEETQHQVTLTQDFYLGVFEVTQKQWERVTGSFTSSTRELYPVERVSWSGIRGGEWPGSPEGSGAPGVGSFVEKLRSRTGLTVDLPTEAEWEYACRAGTTRAYNDQTKNGGAGTDCLTVGNDTNAGLDPLAWYTANSSSTYHDVGEKQANAWGLYDMHGNVWEWCLDWLDAYPGPVSDPRGPASGTIRAIRGGGWNYGASACRSAVRDHDGPDRAYNNLGFRLALPAGQL